MNFTDILASDIKAELNAHSFGKPQKGLKRQRLSHEVTTVSSPLDAVQTAEVICVIIKTAETVGGRLKLPKKLMIEISSEDSDAEFKPEGVLIVPYRI